MNAASSVAAADGVGIQILDANGVVVYDSTLTGMGKRSAGELELDISLAPSDDAADVVTQPVVDDEGETVGTVRVWVYGSDALLTQRDESFRTSSFEAIGLAGLASVLLSVTMGLDFLAHAHQARAHHLERRASGSRRATCRRARTCAAATTWASWARPSTRWPTRCSATASSSAV